MRAVIVGAGAIGSYLGAALAGAGHLVGLLGRPSYVERVRARGLMISQHDVTQALRDMPVDERMEPLAEAIGGVDTALVTTKAFDTAEACRLVEPWLSCGLERVVLVQNGVGGDEIAAGVIPADRLVTGVITQVVATRDVAHYEIVGHSGGLCLASWVPNGPPLDPLVQAFRSARLDVRQYRDARSLRWSKLMLNIIGNAIPAIVDMPVAEAYRDDALCNLEIAAYREALAVVRAAGVRLTRLPGYPVPLVAAVLGQGPRSLTRGILRRHLASGRGGKTPSLQGDLQRGRRESEVVFLNGAVSREGARRGVPTPVNAAITGVLVSLAEGTLSRDGFRGRPAVLIERARSQGWH